MSAGFASLEKILEDETLYERLQSKAKKLTDGFKKVASECGLPLQTSVRGSMFGFFFNEKVCVNMKEVGTCDFDAFALFHNEMLKRGFYFACSQYEAGFICTTMTDDDINSCITASSEVFKLISEK